MYYILGRIAQGLLALMMVILSGLFIEITMP